MTDVAGSTLERWTTLSAGEQPIDICAEMSRLTLRVAGRTLFGTDLTHAADAVGPSLIEALALMNTRAMGFVQLPMWIPTPTNWRLSRALGTLDRLVMEIIENRRLAGDERHDLLGILLSAKDTESGEGLSTRQLRDEVMTFVLAGHETTAVALTWTFHLLSQHPEVESRVRKEVDLILGRRLPTFDDLPELRFMRMVIEEATRLYPPVWAIFRQAIGSDSIRDFKVPEAAGIAICPYVTHRHPRLWPDPDRFDPERFAPERVRDRHRFAYIPFGGGPRLCIGSEFALMEAQLVLAMTLQRYRMRPMSGRTIEPESRLTLRPRGGLPMGVSPLA